MRTLFAFLLSALALPIASADDWPQWMGPKRDNVWRETGIVDRLPKTPKSVWRAPVAGGYAGPAVVGDRLYVTDFVKSGKAAGDNFERKGIPGTERVLCLNATTGKEVWKHEYPVTYTISYPAGPRCTPLVHEKKVYTLGSEGHLICFDAASGKLVWSKELKEEYGTTAPLWGYAAHPLIDGEKLITLAGGKGSQVVALDKNTGKELWRSLDTPEIGQGYVPPSIIEAGGTRQLLILKPDALCSIDPESGKLFWSVPYEADNGAVIMTPVHTAGHVYAGGFNGKNVMVKLEENRPAAKTVWKDDRQLGVSPINVQPFPAGDLIYGINANGVLTSFQVPSGERLLETPQPVGTRPANSGTAFLIRQGESPERCWMFTDSGDLVIGKLSPEKFEELSRAHVIEPTNSAFNRDVVWCSPAFANRRFYVRNDKDCICVDLAASPRQAAVEE
jgi:outer membrane protein assembly factor BamB